MIKVLAYYSDMMYIECMNKKNNENKENTMNKSKTEIKAAELIEKFGKDSAIKTAHAFACTVAPGKKKFWRDVQFVISEKQ